MIIDISNFLLRNLGVAIHNLTTGTCSGYDLEKEKYKTPSVFSNFNNTIGNYIGKGTSLFTDVLEDVNISMEVLTIILLVIIIIVYYYYNYGY